MAGKTITVDGVKYQRVEAEKKSSKTPTKKVEKKAPPKAPAKKPVKGGKK